MTIHDPLSILDLSVHVNHDPGRLMTILKAYGDESGKATNGGEKIISLGAAIGRIDQWQKFETEWAAMLCHWEIPYLHMKEIIRIRRHPRPSGPFAKFGSVIQLQNLLHHAVRVILETGITARSMAVFVDDLSPLLAKRDLRATPYSFTLYAAICMLGTWALNKYPADPSFELILDRLEKGHARIAEAQELYEGDKYMEWRGWPIVTPLSPKSGEGSREIAGLQAADLIAWCVRWQFDNLKQWMTHIKPTLKPMDFKAWDQSMHDHLRKRSDQQASAYPEALVFTSAFARLIVGGSLEFYLYDRERLEVHIFNNREICPPIGPVLRSKRASQRDHPLSA